MESEIRLFKSRAALSTFGRCLTRFLTWAFAMQKHSENKKQAKMVFSQNLTGITAGILANLHQLQMKVAAKNQNL
jgi:DMSO/TMAO reductase YedYZ heme-binding membrane subunit